MQEFIMYFILVTYIHVLLYGMYRIFYDEVIVNKERAKWFKKILEIDQETYDDGLDEFLLELED